MMKTALWFSGGKDSMACLYLYRDRLDSIDVIWANTGRNYPEALEMIAKGRELCPRWHEVKTDRIGQWEKLGYPADVVPIDWTAYGQQFSGKKKIKIQSYLSCCSENLIAPTWEKTNELGCSVVIRGQRSDEAHKAPDGVAEGIIFIHPLKDWTAEQVLDYLRKQMGSLPAHYALEHSSLDCFDCTAYAGHSADRAAYTKEKHPRLYAEYMKGVEAVCEAIGQPMRAYQTLKAIQ